jgi:predicted nucleic acid-binding protein
MIYVLDTNVIAGLLKAQVTVKARFERHLGDALYLCQPVDYEVQRGLHKKDALKQRLFLETVLKPMLLWSPATEADWHSAAHLWAFASSKGRQLSDMDLLIAAIAKRLGAVLVTSDLDFAIFEDLPQENWLLPPAP